VGRRGQKGHGPLLVVRVQFEPNRLAVDCLAAAYEQVAPIRRRTIDVAARSESGHREPMRKAGRGA
jgi:hypothetical protein